MNLNTKILGISAFVSYFGLDALTTCVAVCLYGIGAESNPAMATAMGFGGLAGFVSLKLAFSLGLVIPSYLLSRQSGTRVTGTSALVAIMAGGALAAVNNFQALATGTSLFYGAYINGSYLGPGLIIALAMLSIGLITYVTMSLKDGQFDIRSNF